MLLNNYKIILNNYNCNVFRHNKGESNKKKNPDQAILIFDVTFYDQDFTRTPNERLIKR